MAGRGCGGGCGPGRANEDNARFLLLGALLALYLLGGAAVFSALERPHERQARQRWEERLAGFGRRHNLSRDALRGFLRHFEEAAAAGVRVDGARPRWDFPGAFYFVGTVVSTIGFGMATPATVGGKVFLIVYGLLGCSSTLLFFNLFLERLITVIAHVTRWCGARRPGRRAGPRAGSPGRAAAAGKPSVRVVLLALGAASLALCCGAAALYAAAEGWGYLDALYFCFVAFSTIGFGDLVSGQQARYDGRGLYRAANFVLLLSGVCCLYSLFNVVSILVRQAVNWALGRAAGAGCRRGRGRGGPPRRNAVGPGRVRSGGGGAAETDGGSDGGSGARRLSGEMVSMKDLLAANKASLAVLQKQLSEAASGRPRRASTPAVDDEFSGGVGAFAIMNSRLAETSADRLPLPRAAGP
ncbi:potassium channel subfamily K member 13 isoform X2 [Cervus canadensis]|uniref:potassium channel subfamily K member 13 isoform X2 n=2 Tax=Cervus canadensis TaxID=1574408 RepID=UPI001C9E86AC|nr:potassium channel subfamily K member 13 isoform X2 [Cervus canadensis]